MAVIRIINRSHRRVVSLNCERISLGIIGPKLHCLIFGSAGDLVANGRKFHIGDSVLVTDILVDATSGVEIPDEYHAVIRARDDLFAALNIGVTPGDGNQWPISGPYGLSECSAVWGRGRLLSLFKYTVAIIVICCSIVKHIPTFNIKKCSVLLMKHFIFKIPNFHLFYAWDLLRQFSPFYHNTL